MESSSNLPKSETKAEVARLNKELKHPGTTLERLKDIMERVREIRQGEPELAEVEKPVTDMSAAELMTQLLRPETTAGEVEDIYRFIHSGEEPKQPLSPKDQ